MNEEKLLTKINSPEDLKKLSDEELPQLCGEIREFLINNIAKTGGHLSSNLGAVEISVGLHRVFSSPKDHIIFDVGHQSYTHKIITGRKDRFDTLRKKDGLSGFMRPSESEHDACISGHASNSVSIALGYARADKLSNKKGYSICVIGDGALTGGMAYEALNDAGRSELPLIVILNDNDMSISKNVGAIAKWLSRLRLKPGYFRLKTGTQSFLDHFGSFGKWLIRRISGIKSRFKRRVLPANIFRIFGFRYLGPADGNNIEQVTTLLSEAKRLKRPVVIHFKTQKGKGYSYSEEAPSFFHGVSPFDKNSGKVNGKGGASFSSVFGDELVSLAKKDGRICAVTAAMELGTGLSGFREAFPERFFDVGIAEEHAVAMSAAMASNEMLPVCAIYSTFLQRSYDQLLHDVALNENHVLFAIDRSGPVGADGPTHHGLFDVSYLRSVPKMAIFAPSSFSELKTALSAAVYDEKGPAAVKYPRGAEKVFKDDTMHRDTVVLKEGGRVTLVSYGIMINNVLGAADMLEKDGISAEVIKINRLDRADSEMFLSSVKKTGFTVICEDCIEAGSMGEMLTAKLSESGVQAKSLLLNFKSDFSGMGTCEEIYESQGLTAEQIYNTVKRSLFSE